MRIFFYFSSLLCAAFILSALSAARAQSSGGDFSIRQTVIASGGATNSASGAFAVGGTIGQTAVGENPTGGNFVLRGGFWNFPAGGTTAATAFVAGRVRNGKSGVIQRVRVRLIDLMTGAEQTAQTAFDGAFRFESLEIGKIYLIRAESKNFVFTPDSHVLQLNESREDVDFLGERVRY